MKRHADRSELREFAAGGSAAAWTVAHLEVCDACRGVLEAERRLARNLDAELAAALDVEPGPGFDARLRARLQEERAKAAARAGWLVWPLPALRVWRGLPSGIGVAALVAIGVAALTLVQRSRHEGASPSGSSRPARGQASAPSRAAPSATLEPAGRAAPAAAPEAAAPRAAGGRGLAARRPAPAEPEVLVPRDEIAALARFVSGRGRWRLGPRAEVALAAIEEPLPLAIAPLAIEPLATDD